MKKCKVFLCILIISLIMSSVNLSYGEILNMGFEDDLNNWNVSGTVLPKTESIINASSNVWTILPRYVQMAELVPSGSAGAFDSMAGVLSLSDKSIAYIKGLFPKITNATYVYRDIELSSGEEFTMGWNYVSTDYEPYNDASLVSLVNIDDPSRVPIINGYYSEVCILGATVKGTGNYSTGSYGSTGWQLAEFKAIYPGTYRLGFAVYNLDDIAYNPYLYLDDWRGTTLKNGVTFEPISKDNNAPPPPESTSIIFSNYTLEESFQNNGSIITKSQITLYGDTLKGNIGDVITECGITNLPTGLSAVITKTGEKTAELSFSGTAAQHNETNSLENLIISFYDGAFTGNNASVILGADSSVFKINFIDYANTITFNQPESKVYGDNPFELDATADSNLTVKYASSNPNIATVDANGTVTIIGVGTTDITASEGGDEYYAPATDVTRTLTVSKKDASVIINSKTKIYGDTDPLLDGILTGFIENDNVTASYSRASGESTGTYFISAVLNPSEALNNYNITYNTADFIIDKRPITVQAAVDNKVYDGTVNSEVIPTITDGILAAGENAVLIQEFDNKNVGTNKTLTPLCKVYDQLHTETTPNYDITYILSASGEITLADPILSLENKTSTYTGNAITIEPATVIGVTGQTPPGNITYTYYTDRACSTLTTPSNSGASANGNAPVYAGVYYVKATIEKTLNYTSQTTAAPGTLTILPANGEALSIGNNLTKTYGDESFILTAAGGSGTGAVSYTSTNPNVASVSVDGFVTINAVGETTISATKASDGNFDAQYTSITITVNKKPVTYTITNNNKTYIGVAQYADVTSDAAGLIAGSDYSITYYLDDTVVNCPVEPGVYNVVVTTLNLNYEGTEQGVLTISNAGQIDFGIGGIPQTVAYKDTFTVYPNGNVNGTTTYEIVSGNASVNPTTGLVSIDGIGEVVIKATNTAENFDVKTAISLFTVQPKTISVTAVALDRPYEEGNTNVAVDLITGVEGLIAEYTLASMVTDDAGVDKVVAVTGVILNSENYKPESTTIYTTVTIGMVPVSDNLVISGLPSSIKYGDDDFRLTATGQGTGDVVWSSSDRTVARINSSTGVVTIKGAGSAVITAEKESDGNYGDVSNSITIEVDKNAVTYSIINNTKIYNGSAQYAVVTPSAISFEEDVDYKVTYSQGGIEVDEPIEAGVYNIYIETLNDNYEGYSSGAILTILEANQTYALEIGGLPNYIEYEDSFALYANGGNGEGSVTWDVASGSEYADVTSGSGIVSINGIGTVTVSATKEGDGNYKDQTAFVTFTTNKKQINVVISNTLKTYNGYAQEANITATSTIYNTFANIADISYVNQADGEETVFKNAGTYNVLVDVNDDYSEYYELKGSLSAVASIKKADIIITADDNSVYYRKNPPTYTYSISGLKGNDSIDDLEGTVIFNCDYVRGSAEGEYDINISGFVSNNYSIDYISGKLTVLPTISSGSSEGSGGTVSPVGEDVVESQVDSQFDDVEESDWFYEAVSYVENAGLMSGTSSTNFEPYLETNRSMIVTILYRLEKEPETTKISNFHDVINGSWYNEAVVWGAQNGIVKGYDFVTFGPSDKITREQLAAILYRYATFKGFIVNEPIDLSMYKDSGEISSWAVESMNWAVSQGIITGTATTTLEPQGYATRAQTAACLMKFIQNIEK